ncbi:MAG: LEA type 2 family protein, partial [Candidatus Thermoplasmatota archaeon]|nr:LEA type 2 family protein [Candidatus Thermoplasmatota archaeon]
MRRGQKLVLAVAAASVAVVAALILSFSLGLVGIPRVTGMESRWGEVSVNQTQIWTEVTVDNPNFFEVPLSSLHYRLLLNNITMAEGQDRDLSLQRGDTVLEYVSHLHLHKIPAWWRTHPDNNETTAIEIEYEATAR